MSSSFDLRFLTLVFLYMAPVDFTGATWLRKIFSLASDSQLRLLGLINTLVENSAVIESWEYCQYKRVSPFGFSLGFVLPPLIINFNEANCCSPFCTRTFEVELQVE